MIGITISGILVFIGFIGILYFNKLKNNSQLIGLAVSILFTIIALLALSVNIEIKNRKKTTTDEKFHLYELKLSDGTIVTDSLYSEKEYFYNKKGTEYYKINIIYSKKLN